MLKKKGKAKTTLFMTVLHQSIHINISPYTMVDPPASKKQPPKASGASWRPPDSPKGGKSRPKPTSQHGQPSKTTQKGCQKPPSVDTSTPETPKAAPTICKSKRRSPEQVMIVREPMRSRSCGALQKLAGADWQQWIATILIGLSAPLCNNLDARKKKHCPEQEPRAPMILSYSYSHKKKLI